MPKDDFSIERICDREIEKPLYQLGHLAFDLINYQGSIGKRDAVISRIFYHAFRIWWPITKKTRAYGTTPSHV